MTTKERRDWVMQEVEEAQGVLVKPRTSALHRPKSQHTSISISVAVMILIYRG
jgi:hypothetical protein